MTRGERIRPWLKDGCSAGCRTVRRSRRSRSRRAISPPRSSPSARSFATCGSPASSHPLVLGFDDLDGYLHHSPYFGAVVGRFANRIGAWPVHPRRQSVPARRQREGPHPASRRSGRLRPPELADRRPGRRQRDAGTDEPGRRPGLSRQSSRRPAATRSRRRRRSTSMPRRPPTRRPSSTSPSTAISTSTTPPTSSTTASGSMPTPIPRPTSTSSPPARSARSTAPATTAARLRRSA